jgi:hypothetical protein
VVNIVSAHLPDVTRNLIRHGDLLGTRKELLHEMSLNIEAGKSPGSLDRTTHKISSAPLDPPMTTTLRFAKRISRRSISILACRI